MKQEFLITHYYHSGFSVAWNRVLFVFDYWRGEQDELPVQAQLLEEELKTYDRVFVMISHEHPDHLDPIVFTWRDFAETKYFIASDMPVGTRGKRMAPGMTCELMPDVTLTAFDSTDLGVSYLLNVNGFRVFHAGDLNFWHWRDESTMKEIEEADTEFRKAIAPLCGIPVDLAFFPRDPRQGSAGPVDCGVRHFSGGARTWIDVWRGADYFILSVKPRLLIPMHYFRRTDIAEEYARTATNRTTQVLAMSSPGEKMCVEIDEEGYMNISFPQKETAEEKVSLPEEEGQADPLEDHFVSGDNPFDESDLPVPQLAAPFAEEEQEDEGPREG